MARHSIVVPVYPWQRVARTVLVDAVVWGPTLLAVVPSVLDASRSLAETGAISPGLEARIGGIGAVALGISGFVTWLLAQPAVDRVLVRVGLGTVPRGVANAEIVSTVKDTAAAAVAIAAQTHPPTSEELR